MWPVSVYLTNKVLSGMQFDMITANNLSNIFNKLCTFYFAGNLCNIYKMLKSDVIFLCFTTQNTSYEEMEIIKKTCIEHEEGCGTRRDISDCIKSR